MGEKENGKMDAETAGEGRGGRKRVIRRGEEKRERWDGRRKEREGWEMGRERGGRGGVRHRDTEREVGGKGGIRVPKPIVIGT